MPSLEGEARPLDALDPASRAAVEQRFQQRCSDIQDLAQRLAQSRDPDAANKAALLQTALEVPDLSFLRAVGTEPVLLAWAHLQDSPDAPKGVLGSWIRSRQPAPAPSVPPGLAPRALPAAAAAAPPAAPLAPGVATIVPVLVERAAIWPVGLLWLLFALLAGAIAYLMLSACGIGWPGGWRAG